jgi:hypothetical protein
MNMAAHINSAMQSALRKWTQGDWLAVIGMQELCRRHNISIQRLHKAANAAARKGETA